MIDDFKGYALDDIVAEVGNLMSDPRVLGRLRAQQQYKAIKIILMLVLIYQKIIKIIIVKLTLIIMKINLMLLEMLLVVLNGNLLNKKLVKYLLLLFIIKL